MLGSSIYYLLITTLDDPTASNPTAMNPTAANPTAMRPCQAKQYLFDPVSYFFPLMP